ncbi:LpqN/LpqT family lipoprotein [Saxibacter everestensis]|uniref:LpqN/LpqT family lipoprotein n=1 Tax=Saxibacter everestensis TaxID=2909229 RepID=A0ABY8QT41_9MICO|nr:LpqN/LpqT family lipoprotein [Brevibacteriaceae bacterium ZFBP1038]
MKSRAVVLPALALSLAVTLSGCSLAFEPSGNKEQQGEQAPTTDQPQDEQQSKPEFGTGVEPEPEQTPETPGNPDQDSSADAGTGSGIEQMLSDYGISATQVSPGELGSPIVTVPTPVGWTRDDSKGPAGNWGTYVNPAPEVAGFTPNAMLWTLKVPAGTETSAITAAAGDEIESLPGFVMTVDDFGPVGSSDAFGIAGTYNHPSGKSLAIASRTVVVEKTDATYVVQLVTTNSQDQNESEKAAIEEIHNGIAVTP